MQITIINEKLYASEKKKTLMKYSEQTEYPIVQMRRNSKSHVYGL